MNALKPHFNFNKRERNGIFFLIILIISVQIAYFYIDFSSGISPILKNEISKTTQKQTKNKEEIKKYKIFPFNPNYLTDFKGYQLGLSVKEIDRLLAFRATGKYMNSAKEFQTVTRISDSLFEVIAPSLKFPDWVNRQSNKAMESTVKKSYKKLDINLVNESDFESVNGIGTKLAKRIVDYRAKLQGFTSNDQVYEVWNIDKEVVDKVLQKYHVIEIPQIKKLNVNTATFKEILKIPYMDYELTKKIVNYREEVAEIQSIEELKKIEGFPLNKFSRIALYLDAK
ncbi:helix-hairpin-helix domain-containing protein [Lutibacter sp.]|uniref:ComEA family DNA-binding protein n=1 Tax=Lutibacter sp. TaxID=1925666 RepID=UPI002734DA1E|nr:helix-hairpin-helix domain-containing protein [Lutibacter sp.]MDP3312286.1 helix-hairpin-helix domain-containing protein [Lutibacter sp.]